MRPEVAAALAKARSLAPYWGTERYGFADVDVMKVCHFLPPFSSQAWEQLS